METTGTVDYATLVVAVAAGLGLAGRWAASYLGNRKNGNPNGQKLLRDLAEQNREAMHGRMTDLEHAIDQNRREIVTAIQDSNRDIVTAIQNSKGDIIEALKNRGKR